MATHLLQPTDPSELLERLLVYSEGYVARVRNALEQTFPRTRRLMGKNWDSLTQSYINGHPSRSFTLETFGRRFPAFLCPINEKAAELARYEWCLHVAFLGPDICAALPAPGTNFRVRFHPNILLFRSRYRITPRSIAASIRSFSYAIYRTGGRIEAERVPSFVKFQNESRFLPLAAFCRHAVRTEDPVRVRRFFQRWFSLGLIEMAEPTTKYPSQNLR